MKWKLFAGILAFNVLGSVSYASSALVSNYDIKDVSEVKMDSYSQLDLEGKDVTRERKSTEPTKNVDKPSLAKDNTTESATKAGTVDYSNIDNKKLKEASKSWGTDVTQERIDFMTTGGTLVGKCTYAHASWSNKIDKAGENPKSLCCSSFVSWCFYYSNVDKKIDYAVWKFLNSDKFTKIKKSERIPGDLIVLNDNVAATKLLHNNHIGIYIGQDKSGKDLFLHCTGNNANGVTINSDGRFSNSGVKYLRYSKF